MNNFGGDRVDLLVQRLVGRRGGTVPLQQALDDLSVVQLLFATFL